MESGTRWNPIYRGASHVYALEADLSMLLFVLWDVVGVMVELVMVVDFDTLVEVACVCTEVVCTKVENESTDYT